MKPTKAAARVPELLQWKEQELADDMATLMKSERGEVVVVVKLVGRGRMTILRWVVRRTCTEDAFGELS
jgi:ABC-type cobalamin/Fe3+-siderophores transport system ATPase subunit